MKEEIDNEVPINDAEEENNPNVKQIFWTKPKKLLVVLICALIVLIIYLIVISSYIDTNKKEDTNEPKPGPRPGPDNSGIFGTIYCNYFLEEDKESNILSGNYKVPKNLNIYVDNIKMQNSNSLKIKGKGKHNVTFTLNEGNFDMKNMFRLGCRLPQIAEFCLNHFCHFQQRKF